MRRATTFILAVAITLLLAGGALAMGGNGMGGYMMGSGYASQGGGNGHMGPGWGQEPDQGFQRPDNRGGYHNDNDWRRNAPGTGNGWNTQETPRTDQGRDR